VNLALVDAVNGALCDFNLQWAQPYHDLLVVVADILFAEQLIVGL
jgi:hypothetical protein